MKQSVNDVSNNRYSDYRIYIYNKKCYNKKAGDSNRILLSLLPYNISPKNEQKKTNNDIFIAFFHARERQLLRTLKNHNSMQVCAHVYCP